jgi:copper(I)-binding protein
MTSPTRRRLLQAGLALGVSFALPAARGCEFFSNRMRILNPWTRASIDGATSAIICMKFDQVDRDDRLIGVETPVAAGAELVGPDHAVSRVDVPIPRGQLTELGETGTVLRLIGLKHPMEIGREYPLKLIFAQAGIVDADLDVFYNAHD